MKWQDKLLLFSPLTWFDVLAQIQLSPYTDAKPLQLLQSALAICIPGILLVFFKIDPRLVLPLSPWTWAAIHNAVPPMLQIVETTESWARQRKDPLPSAFHCLVERTENGRCIHYPRFSLFLPPLSPGNDCARHALLLLPGALIAHTAYSEIAAKISDRGIHVVIVSMEPTRMASPRLASLKRIRSIMKQVQRLSPENISSWSIGGHSLGSFQAMRLARPMGASHLVMWGTANFGSLLSNLTEAFDLQVLVIHGSHDKLCAMNDLEYRQFQTTYFPHQTVFTTIQGAAHSWFASTNETKVDLLGESGISMEQHQDEAGEITADFLLQREQNRRK